MSAKLEPEKCKAFLYVIGKEGREIFNTFVFSRGRKGQIYTIVSQI